MIIQWMKLNEGTLEDCIQKEEQSDWFESLGHFFESSDHWLKMELMAVEGLTVR